MAKYFMFWATYNEDNHGEMVTLDIEGYISSKFFSSEEEMERFLEGYYDPSVVFTEVSREEANLTDDEVKALNGEGFDPEWFKGRTSLFEWVKEIWPDGYKEEYFSGRQPRVAQFVSWT